MRSYRNPVEILWQINQWNNIRMNKINTKEERAGGAEKKTKTAELHSAYGL